MRKISYVAITRGTSLKISLSKGLKEKKAQYPGGQITPQLWRVCATTTARCCDLELYGDRSFEKTKTETRGDNTLNDNTYSPGNRKYS